MYIAHISDIHYSKSWMYLQDSFQRCIDLVNEASPDVVIITGDITDYGLQREFQGVTKELERIKTPRLMVPGNHDARHEGYKKFEEHFGPRFFTREHDGYRFVGIDSSEPDIDEGHVGREQLKWLAEQLTDRSIVFLHHHLVPVPYTGRERNVLVDAGEVLRLLAACSVPLVLSGHKHVPWVWNLDGMVVSTAGTVSCERTGGAQSFDFIEVTDDMVSIEKVDIATEKRHCYTVQRN